MTSEYVTHVLDQLAAFGPVRARRMFGGHGLYLGSTMFGLIVDDVLYLKVDDRNRPDYEAAGSRPFSYRRRGRKNAIVMSYWEVPADVLDDAEALAEWADKARAAAGRAQRARPRKRAV